MRGTALRSYRRRMTTQQPSNRGVSSQRSGSEIQAIGAVAGMIGPILFTVGFVVQGLFRRGEYDPIAETVSALEAGPNGWIQQLNFFVFGILMMIFAVGLGAGLRGGRRRIGSVVVIWWGVGLLVAGLFPLRENVDGETFDPTGLHQPNGAVFFASTLGRSGRAVLVSATKIPTGEVSPDTRCSRVGRWRSCFSLWPLSRISSSAPLHPWAGLIQRLVLAVWFPCLIALAARLLQVSRSASAMPVAEHTVSVV